MLHTITTRTLRRGVQASKRLGKGRKGWGWEGKVERQVGREEEDVGQGFLNIL